MKILIAPLDWGLGHATRCIPVVRYLLEKGCEVIIGADGRTLKLLQQEFPSLEFVVMKGYDISYPGKGSMALKMTLQIPKILTGINYEHERLEELIKEKNIDAVISDNRFGLWSREVPCVFITHQLMVKSPFAEKWIHELNKKYISKYTECWIPDSESEGLSGDLAHRFPLPENAKYIGLLSRFQSGHLNHTKSSKANNLLVILSGPEPQRTVFEEKILKQLSYFGEKEGRGKVLIVQGVAEKNERMEISKNIEMISCLTSDELQKVILDAEIILSRPGYSTVMDLALLKRKMIFVPTPGQTEQEYLARYYLERKIAYAVSQKNFDLQLALSESEKYAGFTREYSGEEFKATVDLFLARVRSGVCVD